MINKDKLENALAGLIANGKVKVIKKGGQSSGHSGSYKDTYTFLKANAKFGGILFPQINKPGTNSAHSVTHSYDEKGNLTILKEGWWASEG